MRHILMLLSLAALPACAQDTLLRHDNYLAFIGETGETVTITAASLPSRAYADDLQLKVIDSDSHLTLERRVPFGESAEIAYAVRTPGLHVLAVASGQSLATVRVDKPFANVAWEKTRLWVCGGMAPLWFMVPSGLKQVEVCVTADVTTEGATVKIIRPDGQVALEKTDDFDHLTRLQAPVPPGQDGKAWQLLVEAPTAPGLIFDDVEVYLGRSLPPFLCKKPEWLPAFIAATHIDEQIVERVPIKARSLTKGETLTVTFALPAVPQAKQAALRTSATDVDYPTECTFTVNGYGPYQIPTTGDATTATVTTLLDPAHLRAGENTIVFKHDASRSAAMGLSDTELLFGNAIQIE